MHDLFDDEEKVIPFNNIKARFLSTMNSDVFVGWLTAKKEKGELTLTEEELDAILEHMGFVSHYRTLMSRTEKALDRIRLKDESGIVQRGDVEEIEELVRLKEVCTKWRDEVQPLCPESIFDMDHIAVSLFDLGTDICNIIGYSEDEESD